MGLCKIGPKDGKGSEMLFQSRNQRVPRENGRHNVTLEETLRPLWKLTYYSGILLDWCYEQLPKYRILRFVRYLTVALTIGLFTSVAVFETIQVLKAIKGSSNIHLVITNLMWLTPFVMVLINQWSCLYRRKEFLNFFKDWDKLEKEFAKSYSNCLMCNSKKLHLIIYAVYLFMSVASAVSLGMEIIRKPEASYLLSNYQVVRENIPLSLVCTFHLTAIMFGWVLMSLGDIVPAFVYFYIGLAVKSLEKDAKTAFVQTFSIQDPRHVSFLSSKIDNSLPNYPPNRLFEPLWDLDAPIRYIWYRFEKLSQMISRANSIFGTFMVASQGGAIFMLTILMYSVFYNLRDALNMHSLDLIIPHSMNFIALLFRFISCVLFSSNLNRSISTLRTTLNNNLGMNWDNINQNDRTSLRSLISRLQSDDLAASPHGLYNITQSTLLTVLSLIVSYVIVLLQSK